MWVHSQSSLVGVWSLPSIKAITFIFVTVYDNFVNENTQHNVVRNMFQFENIQSSKVNTNIISIYKIMYRELTYWLSSHNYKTKLYKIVSESTIVSLVVNWSKNVLLHTTSIRGIGFNDWVILLVIGASYQPTSRTRVKVVSRPQWGRSGQINVFKCRNRLSAGIVTSGANMKCLVSVTRTW